ncbi:triose-phosphate isomerase [Methyloligella sp. GL2]|uniref:triose-phosphate isomerase n=2 Tax=unclassified Methyloligella TaxID=2625955 RepID=UPI00157CE550|nr:triose-phosphate isomerase [Methyloligella sp. GL2]QKP78792.1 triose-phosphate isomerase [Methyloligella sp. GL2]
MNGLGASLSELRSLSDLLTKQAVPNADIMICPPATLLSRARDALFGAPVALGAQDCHTGIAGAHTGDISAEMLSDAGAEAVIVGHSERRSDHGETDALVAKKAAAAHRAGLTAIVCVGETEAQRKDGITLDIVGGQLAGSLPEGATAANTVIAYEPVWAIGTGLTPTLEDVAEVHGFIRKQLIAKLGVEQGSAVRILYGGSVKPSNAAELLAVDDVNGALVGGASLRADDFYGILATYA